MLQVVPVPPPSPSPFESSRSLPFGNKSLRYLGPLVVPEYQAHFDVGGARASSSTGNLVPRMCESLEQHRQLCASDVREPLTPSAAWCLGCARASNTTDKLGHWSEQHRHLGAWMYGSLGDHWHIGAWICESLGAIGNLCPWSCGSLEHHRQPRPLVVREPRAPPAPRCLRCAGASSSIGTLQGHPGASDVRAKERCPRFRHTNVACASGRGDDFPAGQARGHRNIANDSRTRFLISGKYILGWLMHCYGLELGLPILPRHVRDALCLPSRRPIGALALPAFEAARDPKAPCYPHRTVEPHSSSLTPLILIEPKGVDITEVFYLVDLASSHMLISNIKPCMFKKLVVGLRGGSAGPASGEHRSARPYCRRCAPGLNWPGRSSGAVTLKKLECSKQAYASFAKDVFINQERKLGARRRSDTVLVSTINDADQGSADVAFRTPPAPYEKSKSLGSGGSMVARLKLKGIDGRAPPGVEPAA
ncbi:hypothetical protein GOBAR_AA03423 [Gossypium barbadense]|uniref:Uncharacterized protein n=1 Tax=Gossypium barbadense TaxID=3634 RepID=A0A2P5YNH6_GOSBA|nr:hypothetical protein GOBAR_AA03423 [Gossypium barbadense]